MLRKILLGTGLLAGTFILGLLGYLVIIYAGNYVINSEDLVMNTTTTIVDQNNDPISKLYIENRDPVSIKKIPSYVQNAFVATEDSRFYHHPGVDIIGIIRALGHDIAAGAKVEGGSTITQQLAKNIFLSNDKSWLRKTKEAIIAINLERRYSKKKILEMYLNQIYFGHGAYGIETAAKLYFNKDVSQLTVDEAALLAGLPKAPNAYSPITHPQKSKERRNLVLSLMAKQGYITSESAVRNEGKTLGLDVQKYKKHPEYSTYIDMVLAEAKSKYHLSSEEVLRGGYKIVVPMNLQAEKASYKHFQEKKYFKGSNSNKQPEGAFVLLDNKTGGVLAVQGGRDYVREGINRVISKRQPGSTFKPLAVYGPALETNKYTPYSLLVDEKLTYPAFNNYTPENYNHQYKGQMTMYDALRVSENAPAVWLLNDIGVAKSKKYLSKLGFNLTDQGLAIALGGLKNGVSPLQMATSYRAFAEHGKVITPYFIQAIYDKQGHVVGKAKPSEHQVFSDQTAWYMTKMLEGVIQTGTGSRGQVHTALAGKTGSTAYTSVKNGLRDAWFVGYTPKAVGSVWIGYDRTTPSQYVTGSSGDATQLFKDIINDIPSEQHLQFQKPSGVKDLPPPIRLQPIDHLKVEGTLGKYGFPAAKLTWSASSDSRVIYHIYQIENGKEKRIAEVSGTNTYVANFVNPFSNVAYKVVPFNIQTMEEGDPSPIANVEWLGAFK